VNKKAVCRVSKLKGWSCHERLSSSPGAIRPGGETSVILDNGFIFQSRRFWMVGHIRAEDAGDVTHCGGLLRELPSARFNSLDA